MTITRYTLRRGLQSRVVCCKLQSTETNKAFKNNGLKKFEDCTAIWPQSTCKLHFFQQNQCSYALSVDCVRSLYTLRYMTQLTRAQSACWVIEPDLMVIDDGRSGEVDVAEVMA